MLTPRFFAKKAEKSISFSKMDKNKCPKRLWRK